MYEKSVKNKFYMSCSLAYVIRFQSACHCFEDRFFAKVDGITIGCTSRTALSIATSLASLNDSDVGRVHIWDSQLDTLSEDVLNLVKPTSLIIDRSRVSSVSLNSFSRLAERLKELVMKKNMIESLDEKLLRGLKQLQFLDLTGNRISIIRKGTFKETPNLEELLLDQNEISIIEDGAFENLKNLKKLSLATNMLTKITKGTFKGLENLEVLNVRNNAIESFEWPVLNSMKKLITLDVGTNRLVNVDLQNLRNLEKLFLNNNTIHNLKSVKLRNLTSLVLVSLDRNMISEIGEGDLLGLAKSTRLESITLAANNISSISPKAFAPIHDVGILAIQNNQLSSFTSESDQSFLRPLRKLQTLLVSRNQLKSIKENDLPKSLTVLAADHNQIESIDAKAFEGIAMQRLYINNNHLQALPRHTFDSFTRETLEAIDVSGNAWKCVCGEEWLAWWLDKFSDKDVADGVIGCLAKPRCDVDLDSLESEEKSTWVTVVASILAAVSVFILIAIAFLYINDGRQRGGVLRPLSRRVDSDLHTLLGDSSFFKEDETRRIPPPTSPGATGTSAAGNTEKKRVRFEQ
ncbi:unnamed protein product [Auanema sp. JU1783]|nr:unnamed protein product [Auanema sp. JU1783]